jgi:hypothetical protein
MIKYKVVLFEINRDPAVLQAELNAYGTMGWELIQIIDNKAFLKLNPTIPQT